MKTVKSNLKKPAAQAFTPFGSQKVLKDAQKAAAIEFQIEAATSTTTPNNDPTKGSWDNEAASNWSPPKSWGLG